MIRVLDVKPRILQLLGNPRYQFIEKALKRKGTSELELVGGLKMVRDSMAGREERIRNFLQLLDAEIEER